MKEPDYIDRTPDKRRKALILANRALDAAIMAETEKPEQLASLAAYLNTDESNIICSLACIITALENA